MADEVQTQEEEFSNWLDELEDEGEKTVSAVVAEAEAEAEDAEERQAKGKKEREAKSVVTRDEYEVDKLYDKFEQSATDEEKVLLAAYTAGSKDITPAGLKKLMQLAHTNAQSAHKGEEVEEEEGIEPDNDIVEQKAAEMAAEKFGAGPVSAKRQQRRERKDDLRDIILQGKPDSDRALAELLTGEELKKDPRIGDTVRW